jgi:hypothetical protein
MLIVDLTEASFFAADSTLQVKSIGESGTACKQLKEVDMRNSADLVVA